MRCTENPKKSGPDMCDVVFLPVFFAISSWTCFHVCEGEDEVRTCSGLSSAVIRNNGPSVPCMMEQV